MAKGKSIRRPTPNYGHVSARVVTNVLDTTADKFIPLDEANARVAAGMYRRIDLGPDYPNSFMVVR